MNQLIEAIGEPASLELLAEECMELAHAALKLARAERLENPTPKTQIECRENIYEEMADVRICLEIIESCPWMNRERIGYYYKSHMERFLSRLAAVGHIIGDDYAKKGSEITMECRDERACFAKTGKRSDGTGECTLLNTTFEAGKCPFRKPYRDKPLPKRRDMKKTAGSMGAKVITVTDMDGETPKEKPLKEITLEELDYRIRMCANLYGSRWPRELKFLEGCKAVFKELADLQEEYLSLKERYRWRTAQNEVPEDNDLVLATIREKGCKGRRNAGVEVRTGAYFDEEGFVIDGAEDTGFVVKAWMPLLDPWQENEDDAG